MTSEPVRCAQCSADIVGRKRLFCTPKCREVFHNIDAMRGRTLLALLMTADTRRYAGADMDLARYARTQADALRSGWLADDRRAGRRSEIVVEAKMRDGWRAADLLHEQRTAEKRDRRPGWKA